MGKQARWLAGAAAAVILGSGGMGWALAQGGKEILPAGTYAQENSTVAAMTDVRGHWAQPAIELAISKGYVDGYEDSTFRPEQQVSRAEFTKLAVSALKLPAGSAKAEEAWYTPYMNAAVNAGLHQWSDFNSGDWNTPMTRGEMARMAARAAGQKTDEDKKWMYLATKSGLIQGIDDTGTLNEEGTTTRAQAVTIIERILAVKAGKTLEADLHAVSRAEVLWHKTNIFEVIPQYFGKLHPNSQWNPDDLFIESDDGLYRAELDAILAIDLEDPNAPFLEELPPVETLKWYNFKTSASSPYLTKNMPAYLVYFKGRTVFNKDTNVYGPRDYAPVNTLGAVIDDYNALANGNLVGMTNVFKSKSGDLSAVIFPKKMKTKQRLSLELYTPSIPGNKQYTKQILRVVTPEWIGGE
ncbi:MAG: S-layer y protein [Paenibacillaceae bacterium]|jgi:hypothetical protein|nr:S-layer y protein [Paenibacillaceae bacterium]